MIADAVRAGSALPGASGSTDRGEAIGVDGLISADDFESGAHFEAVADDSAHTLAERALAERRSLVQLCLYALDRARSSGVAERIEEGLASVGVTALRPDGQRFDPACHEAGGTVATEDEGLDGVVAETEIVGFIDRGQLLRPPVVTVYNRPGR